MSAPAREPGLPATIDEVIEQLGDIIARSIQEQSRLGLFAALYRKVTVAVKKGIAEGRFENGPRMERLDSRDSELQHGKSACERVGSRD